MIHEIPGGSGDVPMDIKVVYTNGAKIGGG